MPHIRKEATRHYVYTPIQVTLREWGKANALFPELFGWMAERNIPFAGAPFIRFRMIGDMEIPYDIEVGVPVDSPIEGDARTLPGILPAGEYVVYTHVGHPDELEGAHDIIKDWARKTGHTLAHKVANDRIVWTCMTEAFLTDPSVEPDHTKWVTEVAYLLDS